MVIVVGKPDLGVLLKRRHKPVDVFLKDNGVDTHEKLAVLVKQLETEHLVSKSFLEESKACVDKLPKKEKVVEKQATLSEPEPVKEALEEDGVEDPKKKSKKRPKRSNKKSDEDDVEETEDNLE